ncbi:transposase [Lewinella sp. W8]|uniref:transposase n=1 Tax=Lewinella sp. W8 TaxID=2528208 RepID=UPI001C12BA1F|nr:transposase [Lewinella sp. W8]
MLKRNKILRNIYQELGRQLDQLLNSTHKGPLYLQQPTIRRVVLDSWNFLAREGSVELLVCCVMGNHVHVLLDVPASKDQVDLGKVMQRHKSYTAQVANQFLGRTGKPFWAANYFDREVRPQKLNRVIWYILNNPWKAGLVNSWREWPGIFVHADYRELFSTDQ